MATRQWSSLPADVLSVIGNLLNSDVDILRLRSVCSSWRSSLPRPQNPVSFPLKLPLLRSPANFPHYPESRGNCTLNLSTIYRLSPPATGSCANDPSNGWLFKVSETNPNTFSLLDTLIAEKLLIPPLTIPNRLNLLEYRISEICKSYSLGFLDPDSTLSVSIRKVIGLSNYVSNCKFAALVLRLDGSLTCWKFGEDDWTPVDNKGYELQDVIMCNGRCYALDRSGALVSFNSDLNLTVAAPARADTKSSLKNFLVECESDLYMVSRICSPEIEYSFARVNIELNDIIAGFAEAMILKLFKFNKRSGKWRKVVDLGDRVFVLGADAAFGVSARDFKGCKGEIIYLNDVHFVVDGDYGDNNMRGVYHLDDKRAFPFMAAKDVGKIFYPGRWLYV